MVLFLVDVAQASTVLFIGDSQSAGPFGKNLDQLLRGQNKVLTRAVNGSTGSWWVNGHASSSYKWNWGKNLDGKEVKGFQQTPIFSKLVDQAKPDYVILQFGGNYVGWSQEKIKADMDALIGPIQKANAKCMFVSGPDTYVNRDLLPDTIDKIQAAIGDRCAFINSVAMTCYPDEAVLETTPERNFKADGRHYNFLPEGEPLAIEWAQNIYAAFTRFESLNSLSSD